MNYLEYCEEPCPYTHSHTYRQVKKYEYRVVWKRDWSEGSSSYQKERRYTHEYYVHKLAAWLKDDRSLHYRCEHGYNDYQCLNPIKEIKIQKREVSRWEAI